MRIILIGLALTLLAKLSVAQTHFDDLKVEPAGMGNTGTEKDND